MAIFFFSLSVNTHSGREARRRNTTNSHVRTLPDQHFCQVFAKHPIFAENVSTNIFHFWKHTWRKKRQKIGRDLHQKLAGKNHLFFLYSFLVIQQGIIKSLADLHANKRAAQRGSMVRQFIQPITDNHLTTAEAACWSRGWFLIYCTKPCTVNVPDFYAKKATI